MDHRNSESVEQSDDWQNERVGILRDESQDNVEGEHDAAQPECQSDD